MPGAEARGEGTGSPTACRAISGWHEHRAGKRAAVTAASVEIGRQRFDVFCVPCHGAAADGRGIAAGFFRPPPPALITDTLRAQPVGYFYDVITNGKGIMYSYASRVAPEDRWAIVAYLRALQLSQNTPASAVPREELQ